jgi:prepilin-type N-terminal cleavage/methylation domain-containing protein
MSQEARSAPRAGFTLLEVMVALLLLTGAFLAVAQLLAVAGRASDRSRATALGAMLAAQKMEQLRALSWAFDIDGTPLDGLSLSSPGALSADAAGFVDCFDDTGAPVGGGPPPPARAASRTLGRGLRITTRPVRWTPPRAISASTCIPGMSLWRTPS